MVIFFQVGLHKFMIYQFFYLGIFKYTLADDMFWHLYLDTDKILFSGNMSVTRFPAYTASTKDMRCHRSSSSSKTCLTWLIIIFKISPDKKIGIYLTLNLKFGDVTFTAKFLNVVTITLDIYFIYKSGYVGGLVQFYIQPKQMH